ALEDERALARVEAALHLEHGRLVAAKVRDEPIIEPLQDGVLFPEELPLRKAPRIFARHGERVLHDRAVGTELELPAPVLQLGWQVAVAPAQILGRLHDGAAKVLLPARERNALL